MKIQIDIPKKINQNLKVIKISQNFDSLEKTIIWILEKESKKIQENFDKINEVLK